MQSASTLQYGKRKRDDDETGSRKSIRGSAVDAQTSPSVDESDGEEEEEILEDEGTESDSLDHDHDQEVESDEDEEEYDEEFPWIKSIDVAIKAENRPGEPVGRCHAKLIDREPIRADFYRNMDEPSHDTNDLALHIFDRWGCIKSELLEHPIKSGTGVWGTELNAGKFLFIEDIKVNKDNRREGYGRKLVEQVWDAAQAAADDCNFAIVFATYSNVGGIWDTTQSLAPKDREIFHTRLQQSGEDFWHAVGFRRIGSSQYFARAKDPSHPSRSLTTAQDYKRPIILGFPPNESDLVFPYYEAILQSNDTETLKLLKVRLRAYPATNPVWLSVDRHGRNIAHIVARGCKNQALSWLLELPMSGELLSKRDLERETPLEGLESSLESQRSMRQVLSPEIPIAGGSEGLAPAEVRCIQLLRGLTDPSPTQLSQIKYGCTCGECLEGFLSPRVSFALQCEADIQFDMLEQVMPLSGTEWCDYNFHHLERLTPGVSSGLKTNKSIRQGFTNIFGYVSPALAAKKLPTTTNILGYIDREWPPCTKNYLQRGGTVAATVLACFDAAIDQDQYLGDGEHQTIFQEDIEKLPRCRNDGEFMFAFRKYCAMEGLPPDKHLGFRNRRFG